MMLRKFLLVACSLLVATAGKSSHVVGGHLDVQQLSSNEFQVDLIVYTDCINANAGAIRARYSLSIFQADNFDSVFHQSLFPLTKDTLSLGGPCFAPANLCIREDPYQNTISLPDHPAGYLLVVQEASRNAIIANIVNPGSTGMTWTARIPDPALSGGNSSPHFEEYPPEGYLCINNLLSIDLSASDPDGDSLSYELVTPLSAPAIARQQPFPNPPPYPQVVWGPGFSLAQITPGPIPLQMDPVTGIVSVHPNQLGTYVFSYLIREYRNDILIGEIRRDLQLEVLRCQVNEEPAFTEPQQNTFSTPVSEEVCIPIQVQDPNSNDTIILTSSYKLSLAAADSTTAIDLISRTDTGTASGQVCWSPNCEEAFGRQELELKISATSIGCDGSIDEITKNILITVDPLPQNILALFPNVFTPNGDGVNDIFRLQDELTYPCIGNLNIRIFNRWGVEVYENALDNSFAWDGTFEGNEVSEGVYYFVVSGNYGSQSFEAKGFLTLMR